ncbi:hypothetical protein K432DRAFT_407946 [Lepidopterella palustris CBS 459.81]|uniref:Protein kinase domain-containing protein n=1 Tax=Lepidopterella palustris CBS 459.81 TaxID=1314670 RepID=A0A8E2E3V3_9PEZI|nr:hypothetical protein K432DRAFT_407946 [Lepidopterella palustris CBS 459.81]
MGCGNLNFNTLLKRYIILENAKLDLGLVRYHWKEMLACVAFVQKHDGVLSDLNPANFLLVKGRLKLIDFGNANAIQDNTVNVRRDHQVGTPNCMAPEALIDSITGAGTPNGLSQLIKVCKPSDIWSRLYTLIDGVWHATIRLHHRRPLKAMAITYPNHIISYPANVIGCSKGINSCIRTMKACLARDHRERPEPETFIQESNGFFYPDYIASNNVVMNQVSLSALLRRVAESCDPSSDYSTGRHQSTIY